MRKSEAGSRNFRGLSRYTIAFVAVHRMYKELGIRKQM